MFIGPPGRVRERAGRSAAGAGSIDHPKIYGLVVYELSLASAVSRGLLARYQIVVVELTEPVVTPARPASDEKREEQLRGERTGS